MRAESEVGGSTCGWGRTLRALALLWAGALVVRIVGRFVLGPLFAGVADPGVGDASEALLERLAYWSGVVGYASVVLAGLAAAVSLRLALKLPPGAPKRLALAGAALGAALVFALLAYGLGLYDLVAVPAALPEGEPPEVSLTLRNAAWILERALLHGSKLLVLVGVARALGPGSNAGRGWVLAFAIVTLADVGLFVVSIRPAAAWLALAEPLAGRLADALAIATALVLAAAGRRLEGARGEARPREA